MVQNLTAVRLRSVSLCWFLLKSSALNSINKDCVYIYLKFINGNFDIQVPVGFLLFLSIYMFCLSSLDGFCLTYLVFSVETLFKM